MVQKPLATFSLVFFSFFTFLFGSLAFAQAQVVLNDDAIIWPPFLQAYLGSEHVNVDSGSPKKREVRPGEWLEYGDFFDLGPSSSAAYVIQRENVQWVGGGVFQGKIGDRVGDAAEAPSTLHFYHGWMRVWIKPGADPHPLKIETNNLSLIAEDAIFWVNTHESLTEVYLQGGSVKVDQHAFLANNFISFAGKAHQIKYTSQDWHPEALEVRLAALYPNFVKLTRTANANWEKNKTDEIYGDLRKKGRQKADRLQPDKDPSKKGSP